MRGEFHGDLKQLEVNIREDVREIRRDIREIKDELAQLRAGLELEGQNRVDDDSVAFSELQKYARKIKSLEARVKKLESQQRAA
ncbi:hypothetical protein FWF74_03785 [Candidatus Saccharibacteria bacterium]|nr:hypothetical protein [Candidatus Saccharibacteria bacterium]MCL1963019.1 hypothetical protein [Candidatus Saccharibacteria bacterium]